MKETIAVWDEATNGGMGGIRLLAAEPTEADGAGRTYDRDELDRLCGISEPWHDLDPEGVMWS